MKTLKIEYNGKYYGVVGKNNIIVVPCEYDEIIRTFSSGLINVCKNNKWGCLDLEGNVVIPIEYDWIFPFGLASNSVTSVRLNGKWGLINKLGEVIVPIVYDKEIVFKGKTSSFPDVNGNTIIINPDGTIQSDTNFDVKLLFNNFGIAISKKEDLYGLVNEDGRSILGFEYNKIQYLSNRKCFVLEKNGLFGLASSSGEIVINAVYNHIGAGDWKAFIVKKENRYGAINYKGDTVIPIEYDEIKSIGKRCFICYKNKEYVRYKVEDSGVTITKSIIQNEDISIVKKHPKLFVIKNGDGRFGLVSKQEEMLTPLDLEEIRIIQTSVYYDTYIFAAKRNGFWGLLDMSGRNLTPYIYTSIGNYDGVRDLIEVFKSDYCGLIRSDGRQAAPCFFTPIKNKDGGIHVYDVLALSSQSNCIIMKKDGFWGALDSNTMRELVSFNYNQIENVINEGFIRVKRDNRWGLINNKFKLVLDTEYDAITIHPPLIKVKKNNKWGAFNMNLKLVAPVEKDSIKMIEDGKIKMLKNGQLEWKLYKKDGEIVDLKQYSMIEDYFSQGISMVKKNDKYGFINEDGVEIIPCIYDDAHHFLHDIAIVEYKGYWGALNNKGEVVIPFDYLLLADLSMVGPTLLMAVKDRLCGVLDKTNRIIVPFEYDGVLPMFGMITVIKNGKKGLYNHKGEMVVSTIYDDIECPFINDTIYRVCNDGKWGAVNKRGEEIVPLIYKQIGGSRFACGRLSVCKNGKWGFVDRKGKEVIPCIYDKVVQWFEDNHCEVRLNKEKIIIDIYGNRIM